MEVDDYGGRAGMLRFHERCRRLAADDEVSKLAEFLSTRAGGTEEKHEVARIAAAALVSAGESGIAALGRLLEHGDVRGLRASAALRALWRASQGLDPLVSAFGGNYPRFDVPPEQQVKARVVLDDFIASAATSADRGRVLVQLQHEELTLAAGTDLPPFNRHVLNVTRESSIVLTNSLIERWEGLVRQDLQESKYQNFLEEYPVFIDPLAARVYNRKRLGIELVTDFVVRRHDSRYVVVEIEKPKDRIFTSAGDFSAAFSHASGQVLDFQGWVAEHTAYAQKRLPGIEGPHGVLIMGRRSQMDVAQRAKLRRWLTNSKHIEVLTFDDLTTRARALHASLRGLPA
jgi:hypothetical protein